MGASGLKNCRKARGAKASLKCPKFVRVFRNFYSEMSRCPSKLNKDTLHCQGEVQNENKDQITYLPQHLHHRQHPNHHRLMHHVVQQAEATHPHQPTCSKRHTAR